MPANSSLKRVTLCFTKQHYWVYKSLHTLYLLRTEMGSKTSIGQEAIRLIKNSLHETMIGAELDRKILTGNYFWKREGMLLQKDLITIFVKFMKLHGAEWKESSGKAQANGEYGKFIYQGRFIVIQKIKNSNEPELVEVIICDPESRESLEREWQETIRRSLENSIDEPPSYSLKESEGGK